MQLRYRKSVLFGAIVMTAVAVAAVPEAASATTLPTGTPVSVLQTLQRVNTSALETAAHVMPTGTGPTALRVSGVGGTVTIPHDPSTGVRASGNGETVTVGLPFAEQAKSAQPDAPGVVSYDNGNGSTTVPIAQNDGSVQIATILDNASAPTRFSYPVTIPAGGSLLPDTGGVDILDASGAWIGGFAPAWAKDAHGTPVATRYEVQGNTLTQVIDPAPNTAYPVVADPFLGFTLVNHVKWENVSKWSPTLAVFPTNFTRFFAPTVAEPALWNEVKAKGGPAANTPTMRVQLDCHFFVVRLRSPRKPSWDLDSKRPAVPLGVEINYSCNYPDGQEILSR
jgi:hypothetical protein